MYYLLYILGFLTSYTCSFELIGKRCEIDVIFEEINEANYKEIVPSLNRIEINPGDDYVIRCPYPDTSLQINDKDIGMSTMEISCKHHHIKLNTSVNAMDMRCLNHFKTSLNHGNTTFNHHVVKRSWFHLPQLFKKLITSELAEEVEVLLPEIGAAIVDLGEAAAAIAAGPEIAAGAVGVIGAAGAYEIGKYVWDNLKPNTKPTSKPTPESTTQTTTTTKKPKPCFLEMVEASPLVLQDYNGNFFTVYPYEDDTIEMAENQEYTITCGQSTIEAGNQQVGTSAIIKCTDNGQLSVDNEPQTEYWNDIWCSEGIARSSIKVLLNGVWVEWINLQHGVVHAAIGWNVGLGFYPQIAIFYDEPKDNTIQTFHVLQKKFTKIGIPRVQTTFLPELGYMSAGYYWFNDRQWRVYQIQYPDEISKGHLTPNGDFVYPCQRKATYYYANTLPQWKTFNNGDWNIVEQKIGETVSANSFHIYTGGYGNMKSGSKKMTLLDGGKAPVPEAFWKIVFDPVTDEGIGFIGLNRVGPYYQISPDFNRLITKFNCRGVCQTAGWDLQTQRVFCCHIDNMRPHISGIPPFVVTAILDFVPPLPITTNSKYQNLDYYVHSNITNQTKVNFGEFGFGHRPQTGSDESNINPYAGFF